MAHRRQGTGLQLASSVARRLVACPAWVALLIVALALSGSALAETNSVTGGIAGINNGTLANGDGTGDASIEVSGVTLALVKQARDLAGTVIASGSDVSAGQTIYFVLYVDNSTSFEAADVRITDLIDEAQFTYVPLSLERTAVATGSDDATIWAGTWTGRTDGVGDDEASATDTGGAAEFDRITIGAVPAQTNTTVDMPGLTLTAYRFQVTVD